MIAKIIRLEGELIFTPQLIDAKPSAGPGCARDERMAIRYMDPPESGHQAPRSSTVRITGPSSVMATVFS